METIGKRILQVRNEVKLNQRDFAKRIGISGGSVSMIETETNNPSEQTIKLICREFGVSYGWLKFGHEPMMVPKEYVDRGKVEDILDGDNEFVKRVFIQLADMPAEWWEMAEKALRDALGIEKDR